MSKTAHILAIVADSIGELGFGISSHQGDVEAVMNGVVWAGPRPVLETNDSFVQPIPYIVMQNGEGKILTYRRGSSGGEDRLHAKLSIGIGGHVDAADALYGPDNSIDLRRTLQLSAKREIAEEVGIHVGMHNFAWTHVISTYGSPVDRVHVGLVCTVSVEDDALGTLENTIENAEWLTLEELRERGNLENWTLLVVESLLAAQPTGLSYRLTA